MPFDPSFNDLYQLGIKPAAEGSGAYCERIDEQLFDENILARLYNQIAKADLIVADMTGRNPNVFYEVGYAHALGQKVILLTKNADDIPFDLKHYPHIVYQSSIASLKESLQKRIAHHLANPTERTSLEMVLPEFSISGNLIKVNACIEHPMGQQTGGQFALVVGVTNAHDTVSGWTELSAGLLLPPEFRPASTYGAVQVPDKRYMHDLGSLGRILPGAWQSKVVNFFIDNVDSVDGRQTEAELRIFTPTKPVCMRFYLKFVWASPKNKS
jgi:hypothetical protein